MTFFDFQEVFNHFSNIFRKKKTKFISLINLIFSTTNDAQFKGAHLTLSWRRDVMSGPWLRQTKVFSIFQGQVLLFTSCYLWFVYVFIFFLNGYDEKVII